MILSGTGTLNYNVASAVSASAASNSSTDNGFRITGGTLDNTRVAGAINTNTSTQSIDLAGTLTFAGSNGADSNLHLGSGAVFLKGGNRQITVTNSATTLTIGGVIQNDNGGARGLTKAGAGTLRLSGTSSTYTGVSTITAGTLSVASIGNGGVAGSLGQATNAAGNIVFNGGTLLYTGANATSDRAFTINTGITATIETTNNLSLAGATGAATTGAFTKTGAGALTLTGASTYTGATNVNAGTLLINGSTSTGAVNVASGATLGGTGALNVNSGGIFAPGNGGIESLDVTGTLTLGGGSISNFEINTTGNAADLAFTSALLTFGGTLNVTNVGAALVNGNLFNLFDWGTTTGSFTTVNLPALTGGLTWDESNLYTNGTIAVVPEPASALLGATGMLLLLRRRRA